MEFIADLHIHSYLSRATAKNLDLAHLHWWAQLKGITVVGTGDFTHPQWFSDIQNKLEPAEPGLFKLRDEVADVVSKEVPPTCRAPVRFLLSKDKYPPIFSLPVEANKNVEHVTPNRNQKRQNQQ